MNQPDTLAALAADQQRPKVERDRAFAGLQELIRGLAISLSIRLTARVRPELVDGAVGEIYLRLGGFTPGNSFASWCHRTLHNWMVDELRKETQRQGHEHGAARLRPEIQAEAPAPEPFSPEELDQISAWPLGQRLALLCLTGLWRVVPGPTWQSWWSTYPSGDAPILSPPFPPAEFEACPDSQERANILAELLRVRRGTLAVWVHRCGARLRELRGV